MEGGKRREGLRERKGEMRKRREGGGRQEEEEGERR